MRLALVALLVAPLAASQLGVNKAAAERRAFETAAVRKIEKPRVLTSRFDDAASAWRVDLAGTTPGGCSILKVVVPANDGKVTFKDREITGSGVKVDRCIEAWSKETHENPRRDPADEADADAASELPTVSDSADEMPVVADDSTPAPRATATAPHPAATPKPSVGVGVPECDSFLDAYSRFIDTKMPAGNREGAREGLSALRDVWRDAASRSAEARKQLPETCTKVRAETQTRVASFGCEL